jgi:hypothetical protein
MNSLILASVLAGLASPPATADVADAKPPVYPLTARLTLSPEAAAACIASETSRCVVQAGNRARVAYQDLIGNLFRPVAGGATPDLDIVIVSIFSETATTSGSRSVTVITRAQIVAPRTGEVDELRAIAYSPVPSFGDGSVAGAGLKALDECIARFPRLFADSEKVARWLVGRGFKPADLSAIHSTYGLTAKVALQPEAANACVPDEAGKCIVGLGDRTRTAYESAIRNMFRPLPEGATPDVEITVTAVLAEPALTVGGRSVAVTTRARISAPATGEIDEVSTWGDSPVLGPGDDPIGGAGLRALDAAVAGFRDAFANSESIQRWLLTGAVSRSRPAASPPLRGAWVAFGELGVGSVGSSGDATIGIAAHLGFEGKWFVLQGVAGRWQTTINSFGQRDMTVWDLGVEAGPVLRLGQALEVRAGAGIHTLFGSVAGSPTFSQEESFETASPSVFLALQFSIWPSERGRRLRIGAELRQFLSAGTSLQKSPGDVALANTYLGIYLGFELPWPFAKAGAPQPRGR